MRFAEFKNIPLVEGLTHKDPVERWIAVFKNSTHPKFAGKSPSQREKMARAAHYRAVQNNSMRFDKIKEGIRMGARDLATPAKKDYTIGFEFEVAVDDRFIDSEYYAPSDVEDDYGFERWEEFEEYWYDDNPDFFEQWFASNYLDGAVRTVISLQQLIDENEITPSFGYFPSAEEIAKEENRKEEKRVAGNIENLRQLLDDDKQGTKITRFIDLIKKYKSLGNSAASSLAQNIDDLANITYVDQKRRYADMNLAYIYRKIDQIKKERTKEEVEELANKYLSIFYFYLFKNEQSAEDIDTSKITYVYTRNGKKLIPIEDINSIDTFLDCFDVEISDLKDFTRDEYDEVRQRTMDYEFQTWLDNQEPTRGSNDEQSKLNFVMATIRDTFEVSVMDKSSKKSWAVIPDGTPGVDAEITTPAFSIDEGIQVMHQVLDLIQKSDYIYTAKPTGLHINFGTFTEQDIARIDLLKFLMILNAERILIEFDRSSNIYTKDRMSEIIEALTNNDFATYLDNVRQNNAIIRSLSTKFSAINFAKLNNTDDKLIELRAPGNVGYEKKGAYLETTIRRVVRALELASDPNQYKKEYISMLYKRFEKENIKKKLKSKNPLEDYLLNTFELREFVIPDKIFRVILLGVIYGGKTKDPNKGYTIEVHKNVSDLMKKFFTKYNDIQKIDMANGLLKQFNDILTDHDKSGNMRNSMMVKTAMNYLSKISKGQK